jgi:hypothetical protein
MHHIGMMDTAARWLPMLADLYGWFTEDFDTADLKDAKALLDEVEQIVVYRGSEKSGISRFG